MVVMIGIVLVLVFSLQERRISNLEQQNYEMKNERGLILKDNAVRIAELETKNKERMRIAKKEYSKVYDALKIADVDCLERLSVELSKLLSDDENFEDEEDYDKHQIVLEFIKNRLHNME